MRFASRLLFRRGIGRRAVCAFLLGAYIVTAAGIPLPLASGPVKTRELFPCAMTRCGCDSAERCWRSCCCHSLAERLAWARRNGVRPPAFAVAQARAAGIYLSLLADTGAADERPGSCCMADRLPKKPACCAKNQITTNANESNRAAGDDHIVGWRALACRGQAVQWLAAVPTLIVPPRGIVNDLPLIERRAPAVSEAATSVPHAPDVPPPEVAFFA
jgi:hypothetical protein